MWILGCLNEEDFYQIKYANEGRNMIEITTKNFIKINSWLHLLDTLIDFPVDLLLPDSLLHTPTSMIEMQDIHKICLSIPLFECLVSSPSRSQFLLCGCRFGNYSVTAPYSNWGLHVAYLLHAQEPLV